MTTVKNPQYLERKQIYVVEKYKINKICETVAVRKKLCHHCILSMHNLYLRNVRVSTSVQLRNQIPVTCWGKTLIPKIMISLIDLNLVRFTIMSNLRQLERTRVKEISNNASWVMVRG